MIFDQPARYELEVSVFGKGLGECIVVHYGGGQWLIIDSFTETNLREPIALQYLNKIGVDPASDVRFVLATHWHEDHIRGIASVFNECRAATFVCSSAYTTKEFKRMIEVYKSRVVLDEAGLRELYDCFKLVNERRKAGQPCLKYAGEDKRIDQLFLEDELEAAIWTLSPSTARQHQALMQVASLFEGQKLDIPLKPLRNPNDLSVACCIRLGHARTLLGADLEETGRIDEGWTSVISSTGRPQETSSAYKVSHHGSANGDHPEIWTKLLSEQPETVVTPFSRLKRRLPTKADANRILINAPGAYLTSRPQFKQGERLSGAARKIVSHIRRERPSYLLGHVKMRIDGRTPDAPWTIELDGDASLLASQISQLFD